MKNETTRRRVSMCVAALGVSLISSSGLAQAHEPPTCLRTETSIDRPEEAAAGQAAMRLGLRGVHFVPNQGQWTDEAVHYGFRSRGMDIAFRASALTMHLRRALPRAACMMAGTSRADLEPPTADFETMVLEVTFPGSNRSTPLGTDGQATRFNYFIGDDASTWRSHVPSFAGVVYRNIYDGIDLHVTGSDHGVLKYEFHCAPGSDHEQIRIHYDGIDRLHVDEAGNLMIETPFGTLADGAPIVWQEDAQSRDLDGRSSEPIAARFETLDATTYTVKLLSDPDPTLPLVIDPEVLWMTYLGGSGGDWRSYVDVNADGDALVTGYTLSTDFEGRNNSPYADHDGFVLKVLSSGHLEWMTYIGGTDIEDLSGVAADSAGKALVTGWTRSLDFAGATNSFHGGDRDAFALQVDSSGVLQWMIYLGGSSTSGAAGHDEAYGITVDEADNVYVTGWTNSADFEGAGNSLNSNGDAFALKLTPWGELDWMMFLGGSGVDRGLGIAAAGIDNLLISGVTKSHDFPGATNSSQGGDDAFALKVNPSHQIQWMTYLGGSDSDWGRSVAVDSDGNALVAGETDSIDFEGRDNPAHGDKDGFLSKLGSSGELQWMIYLGGSGYDVVRPVAVDSTGEAVVAGFTQSTDFEGRNNAYLGGNWDGLALKVRSDGSLLWMMYLGGSIDDDVTGLGLDGLGNAFVSGATNSDDIAQRNNMYHGGFDATLFKIRLDIDPKPADITDVTVAFGALISGGVPELLESDDEYVNARSWFGFSALEPNLIDLHIGAHTDAKFPGTADLSIESNLDTPGGRARLGLRNWNTNTFDIVREYALATTDAVENILGVGLGERVRSDGRIEALLRCSVVATFSAAGFEAFCDHITVTVN